ncbi:MAG: membrane protein insertase YidC [Terriglobia bacterium]
MDDTNKRVLIAFALSFVILIGWRYAFPPPPEPVPPKKPAPTAPAQPSAPTQAPGSAQAAGAAAKSALPPPAVTLPVQQGTKAEEIAVESDLYRVTLSTEGGVVKSWILKKFQDEHGKPLDVVNGPACEKLGFPLNLMVGDAETGKKINSALFVASPGGSLLQAPAKLELAFSDGKIQVKKRLEFGSGYEVRVEVSAFDGQRNLPVEVAWPGGFGDQSLLPAVKESLDHVIHGLSEKPERLVQHKIEADQMFPGPQQLMGMDDRYFLAIFIPDAPDQVALRVGRRTWNPPDWKEKEPPKATFVGLSGQGAKPLAFRLFVGPKDLDVLRAVSPPLDHVVDFGWFSFVAKPLFLAMRYIHDRWVHNYGWAIILLTVIITLAMFPLKLKSIRSAQEMQKIAPIVKGIQEKYKEYKFNDPRKQKMNQEIMKLYQEHHINPLGGCLPMVLQLPFLYGFYKVLDLSIELRHAPWFLWIKDLSAPDHMYILPSLMIVTMFILQKMTPVATADPAQQRMMMIMPLIFGIMFFKFASGLVLYWLTSNVVGIAQQVFINRMMPAPQKLPVAPKKVKSEA